MRLEFSAEGGPVTLHDRFDSTSVTIDGALEIELDPYGWRWLQVTPADATVRRV